MEPNFGRFISASGIGQGGLATLEEENVLTSGVFTSLREEHFEKLLPLLKIGEHATLLKLWESCNSGTRMGAASREVSYV